MTSRPKVHVLVPVPDGVGDDLQSSFELVDRPEGSAGIVAAPGVPVDAALLDRAGAGLRVVANYAVGVDNVDLEAAAERGVVVTNTPDVLTNATAELTLALLLALVRRVGEGDRLIRRRHAWRWQPTFMPGRSLEGMRLLVVGAGRIGTRVTHLADAFGMHVSTAGRSDDLVALLASVDAVTLHVPLTEETRGLIGRAELHAMRRDAVLVNTSRGAVLDEAALVAALEAGEIAGAALDVFEHEPDVHPGLLDREDVVLTPHLGSATAETRLAMGALVVESLRSVLLEDAPARFRV